MTEQVPPFLQGLESQNVCLAWQPGGIKVTHISLDPPATSPQPTSRGTTARQPSPGCQRDKPSYSVSPHGPGLLQDEGHGWFLMPGERHCGAALTT